MSDVTARNAVAGSDVPSDSERHEVEGAPLTVGTVLFLASDLMIFAGFFAAYFTLKAAADTWPPADVDLDVVGSAIFTVVFASSAVTAWAALRAARAGRVSESRTWLAATALLGVVFVAGTLLELRDAGFGVDTHAYGTIYWTTLVVHLLHVVAGLFLIGVAVGVTHGRTRTPLDITAAVIAYIWWFVVAMSVAVFAVFYIIQ